MVLSLDELALVRAEIGEAVPPSDDDLDEIHDRRLGLVGVVREVWGKRLAAFLTNPATFAVTGDYSQSVAPNIVALQRRLGELSTAPDDSNEIPPGGDALTFRLLHLVRVGQDR